MADPYEPPFTAADHTKLLSAVLERPLHILKYLNVPPGEYPTNLQLIDAALQVKCFDAGTKARLQAAREGYLRFEEERAKDSAGYKERRARTDAALEGKTIPEMIAAVDDLRTQEPDQRYAMGLKLAKEILEDGADTIYSPDFHAWELIDDGVPPDPAGIKSVGASASPPPPQFIAHTDASAASACPGGDACGAATGFFSLAAAISVILDDFVGPHTP
jgi:hypothetical protein